jgi:hypothetical protein
MSSKWGAGAIRQRGVDNWQLRYLAPGTMHEVHTTLGACLGAAVRTRKLVRSPLLDIAKAPSAGEADHGQVLEPSNCGH